MTMKSRLLVWGATQIVQVCNAKENVVIGDAMKQLAVLEKDVDNDEGYSLVVNGWVEIYKHISM